MKQVLRESLWLLSLQGNFSWFGEQRKALPQPWSYEDFQLLRPTFAASSWRGAMAKAVGEGWVIKTLHQGKTGFLLTKKGEMLIRDQTLRFSVSQHAVEGSPYKTLVLLKRTGKGAGGFRAELPGRWIHSLLACVPGQWYSAPWVEKARLSGYDVRFLVIEPEKALPYSLNDWLKEDTITLQRELNRFSKDCGVLLANVQVKKRLTKKDKQRIGTVLVSGLALFSQLSPDLEPGDGVWVLARTCMEQLLSLVSNVPFE